MCPVLDSLCQHPRRICRVNVLQFELETVGPMNIDVGLSNSIPGTTGQTLLDLACRAEERGFPTLATIDRIAFPNRESLITLGAAAAETKRIGLLPIILLSQSAALSSWQQKP